MVGSGEDNPLALIRLQDSTAVLSLGIQNLSLTFDMVV